MTDKASLPKSNAINKAFNGKTLSATQVYQHGSTTVIEQIFSDSTISFVKVLQGQVEMGGTNEWGTGIKI